MYRLILFLLLVLNCLAQEPFEARFEFVEGGPFIIKPNEVKIVTLQTRNGNAQFEMGLIPVSYTDINFGIKTHYQLYGRNLGSIGQLGNPDQAVHPKDILVVYKDTGIKKSSLVTYDRNNRIPAHITAGGYTYGLRDAWMQEPTASVTLEDGTVAFFALHNRGPFSPYYGIYQTTLNGSPDEDPLSGTHHRWQGGFMKMWDLVVVLKGKEKFIENDPMPASVPDDWFIKTRSAKAEWRAPYPDRMKALYDSLDRLNIVNGQPYDLSTERSFSWWIFQSENRFRYWEDHNNMFEVGPYSNTVGWKNWMDLRWIEGHYNNGYNWVSIAFRRWLDTRSEVSWWIFTRLARWDATSGIVWTSNMTNGQRVPGWRGGWRWYEKGFSRSTSEVGCDYWPSNYKQYSEAILTANLVFKQWWSTQAVDWHGQALFNMGYQSWSGIYGERIPGWGIMNAMAYYRFTNDIRWVNLANTIAQNVLNIMRSPSKLNAEPDPRWRDSTLGVPYVFDSTAGPDYQYSAWQTSKLAIGLTELILYGNQQQYVEKVRQMALFLIEECIADNGDVIVGKAGMSTDRVPAQYWDGWAGALYNVPNPATTDWFIWPIGYAAIVLREPKALAIFDRFINQMGMFLDWEPSINVSLYEIGTGRVSGSKFLVGGINLTGVSPVKHRLRLQNGNTVIFKSFSSLDGVTNEFDIPDMSGINNAVNYVVTITGPRTDLVRSTLDRAVRSITINSDNKPDMKRIFNWGNGHHFNNWQKIVAIPLTQGDIPFIAAKILRQK